MAWFGTTTAPESLDVLGVYIHFPFCLQRCGYCAFVSHVAPRIPHVAYAEAVIDELQRRAPRYRIAPLRSIYVGGGTPSLWEPRELERVLRAVRAALPPHPDGLEVTVEVNPGTIGARGLQRLGRAGVSRLSVGVQALDDAVLRTLGRIHTAAEARQTVAAALGAGVESVSCDLIFGTPGQGVHQHLRQLGETVALGPHHVSTYSLSLEPDAPMARRGLAPADEDACAAMLAAGRDLLGRAGLEHYEVSNFARAGHLCAHNAAVWAGGPYLGLGAGAHSMRPVGRGARRTANPDLGPYLAGSRQEGSPWISGATVEELGEATARAEVMFLGLRTARGVDRASYARRFGADPTAHFGAVLEAAAAEGLVTVSGAAVAPTPRGLMFADELALRVI